MSSIQRSPNENVTVGLPPHPLLDHRHRLMLNLTYFIQTPRHNSRSSWPCPSIAHDQLMHTPSSLQVTADRDGDTPLTLSPCPHTTAPMMPTMSQISTSRSSRKTVRYRLISTLIHSCDAQHASRYGSSSLAVWCPFSPFPSS